MIFPLTSINQTSPNKDILNNTLTLSWFILYHFNDIVLCQGFLNRLVKKCCTKKEIFFFWPKKKSNNKEKTDVLL